jgi:hypothetical protein
MEQQELTRIAQAVLGVKIDGVWGPVTQAAWNQRVAEATGEDPRSLFERSARAMVERQITGSFSVPPSRMYTPAEAWGGGGGGGEYAREVEHGVTHRLGSPYTLPAVKPAAAGPRPVEIRTQDRAEPVALVSTQGHRCSTVSVALLTGEHVADLCPECDRVTYTAWTRPVLPVPGDYSTLVARKTISRTTRMMTRIVTVLTAFLQVWAGIWNGLANVLTGPFR